MTRLCPDCTPSFCPFGSGAQSIIAPWSGPSCLLLSGPSTPSGGTKRATSVNMPLLRLQSSEKFTMSREIEPAHGSFRRHGSCTFTEVARLVPSGPSDIHSHLFVLMLIFDVSYYMLCYFIVFTVDPSSSPPHTKGRVRCLLSNPEGGMIRLEILIELRFLNSSFSSLNSSIRAFRA